MILCLVVRLVPVTSYCAFVKRPRSLKHTARVQSKNDLEIWKLFEEVHNEIDAELDTVEDILRLRSVRNSVAGHTLLQPLDPSSGSPIPGQWRATTELAHFLNAEKQIYLMHRYLGGIGDGIQTCVTCNRRHPDGANGCPLCSMYPGKYTCNGPGDQNQTACSFPPLAY